MNTLCTGYISFSWTWAHLIAFHVGQKWKRIETNRDLIWYYVTRLGLIFLIQKLREIWDQIDNLLRQDSVALDSAEGANMN